MVKHFFSDINLTLGRPLDIQRILIVSFSLKYIVTVSPTSQEGLLQ